ncbi:MAG TPA: hypothetical protein VN040_14135 [Pseudosphingobacterium sp.]|nr:hypothetical protein [Pseudosphingobacterium sp.]
MHTRLKERLWAYIVQNNPDLMFNLQEEYAVIHYLEEKVSKVMPMALRLIGEGREGHAIEELCVNEMTKELRPSRYNYICNLLEQQYRYVYYSHRESGNLTYLAVSLVEHCRDTFNELGFSEKNQKEQSIHAAILEKVGEYLAEKNNKR